MGEELRGIVGEGVGRSPGICLGGVVGVAEERVVIALGGCCSPLHPDSKAPFSFPFKADGMGGEGRSVHGCVCKCVCAPGCAWWWWSGEVGF